MKRFCFYFLACAISLAACTTETPVPNIDSKDPAALGQTLSGMYAYDDGSGLSDKFVEFSGKELTLYTIKSAPTFAECNYWHCSKKDFTVKGKEEYTYIDTHLSAGALFSCEAVFTEGDLYLNKEKYSKFEGFKEEYYSSVTLEKSELTITSDAASHEFNATITNPISAGSLSAKSETEWIKLIKVGEGKVQYSVSETEVDRTGTITLSYTNAADSTVTIKQTAPTCIILPKTEDSVSYMAGEGEFAYSIQTPINGVDLSVTCSADWVSGITVKEDKVIFNLTENASIKSRSCQFILTYGSYPSAVFAITQQAMPVQITLDKTSLDMIVDEQETLTATVEPSDAVCTWESSDVNVATVSSNGQVSAVGSGTATIMVKSEDKSATCVVNVTGKDNELSLSTSWNEETGIVYGNTGTITISNPSGCELSIISSPDATVATANSISSNRVTITPVSSGTTSITIKSSATSRYVEAIKTVSIKVLKATPTFSIDPISLMLTALGQTKTIAIKSNSDCTFTAQSSNPSVASASVSDMIVSIKANAYGTATITVNCPETERYASAESLTCEVLVVRPEDFFDLSASGTANCYIVNNLGYYKFKAVQGNTNESVGSVASAEVLWESFGTDVTPNVGDIINNVNYADGYVQFSTPATLNNGNAVVAVKDASDNILWSWHIWVCDGYDPVAKAQVYNNAAGTMMDRNLGATSATPGDVHALGLLYQWGRKDPFLGSSSISSDTNAASTLSWPSAVTSDASYGRIAYAVAHPTTFIGCNSRNYDWYYTGDSSTDETRWNSSKGVYDPCPAGWRVPDGGSTSVWSNAFGTSSSWNTTSNWDSVKKGMDFASTDNTLGIGTIWYPAAGLLNLDIGSLLLVGICGYYWSCSSISDYAYFLNFNDNSYVIPSKCGVRSLGQSVRCLRE